MSLFNELSASLYIYIMLLLTDFWGENHFRNLIGELLCFFIYFVVGVNAIKVIKNFIVWGMQKL